MDNKGKDRRVRRSRRALQEAMRSLILEKGYDRVTVQDVIDRADVGRATFYAHFRDKDDLLMSGAEEMRRSLRQLLATVPWSQDDKSGERFGFTRILFDHAADRRKEYRALMGSRSGGTVLTAAHKELRALLRGHFDNVVAQGRAQPKVPPEVVTQYVVSALLAVLTWWLDNGLPYTAEQMAQMFDRMTRPAIAAALSPRG